MNVLLQGTRFRPADALKNKLVDELVPTREDLVPAAKAWIKANPEAFQNPWDAPGYKMPGGSPKTPALAAFLPAFPALLRKQLKGADYPAQRAILSAAVEGAQVDFDTASRIESRYLTSLIVNQGSKNMIQAFFFDLQAINSGSLRPQGIEPWKATKVGVLGAGMMGAGIALRLRQGRHGGRPQGRRAGQRRQGQGLLGEAARQGDLPGQEHRGEEGRAPRRASSPPPTRPTSRAATS